MWVWYYRSQREGETWSKKSSLNNTCMSLKDYQTAKHWSAVYKMRRDFTTADSFHFILHHDDCDIQQNQYFGLNDMNEVWIQPTHLSDVWIFTTFTVF